MRADDVERVSSPGLSDDDVLATLRLRLAVEDFVTHDAELLDSWRLDEWLAQFTDDCRYLMPAAGWPDSDPERDLFFVQDDRFLLGERIASMLSGTAWAESPRSTTHHVIGNVQASRSDDGVVHATAKGIATRSSGSKFDLYPYTLHLDLLTDADGHFRIRTRRVVLGLEQLRPHGRVSILL